MTCATTSELLAQAFQDLRGNAGDFEELFVARGLDSAHRAEALDERLLAFGADARDRVEARADHAFLADELVVGDGEAMRLVADALDEVEGLGGPGEEDGLAEAWAEDLFAFFGEADGGDGGGVDV